MGDHGLVSKGVAHYDSCIRTPLIVTGGMIPKGVCSRLTTSLDLYPTFCEWAGIPVSILPPIEGISFSNILKCQFDDPHLEIGVNIDNCSSIITQDGYRLTINASTKIEGQLFNLFKDPSEQINLYYNNDFSELRQRLTEQLVRSKTSPSMIPQYCVLPIRDNKAYIDNGCSKSIPVYSQPPSPWHENIDKPCWRS